MLSLDRILNNRYRIDRLLELGAVETIYIGWDILTDTKVTISETKAQPNLKPDICRDLKNNFLEQAVQLCQLRHEYIIPPSDCFIVDTRRNTDVQMKDGDEDSLLSYMVSPAVQDPTLFEVIKQRGQLPEKSVIVWADQLLHALFYCHQQNVLHGDIRPHNIAITAGGSAKLVNFEVPMLWQTSDPRRWTAKRVLGTPDYAPPEKWAMRVGQIDERSDLYSMGATLYHALTGQLPLSAEKRIADPYNFQDIRITNPRIKQHTRSVIVKSMAIPQDKRYPNALEMAGALIQPSTRRQYDIKPSQPKLLPFSKEKTFPWLKSAGVLFSALIILISAIVGLWLNTIIPSKNSQVATQLVPSLISTGISIATAPAQVIAPVSPTLLPDTPEPTAIPIITTEIPTMNVTAVISDAFDSNTNDWPLSDSQDEWGTIVREIVQGLYIWRIGAEQDVGRWCLPDVNSYATDFRISVDVKRQNGPLNIAYGLILRHDEGRYYVFNVRDDGYYRFSLWQGFEWVTIVDWTEIQAVQSGETNHLEVVAQGSKFEFFVNGAYVGEAENAEIAGGDHGLSAIVLAHPEIAVLEFDNFTLITDGQ
ncbi:MAG: protein kinase [Anaerolineae bacterium]|nr:protein kinase [Anaerolineae bacterium]